METTMTKKKLKRPPERQLGILAAARVGLAAKEADPGRWGKPLKE